MHRPVLTLTLATLASLVIIGGWLATTLAILAQTLPIELRQALAAGLAERIPLLVLFGLGLVGLLVACWRWLFRRYLWAPPPAWHGLAATPLRQLVYTVLDTETTGLDPQAGDAVVQVAAVRIANGLLLLDQGLNQLLDPCRPIPAAASAVHGITDGMVAGQPSLQAFLPTLWQFAHGSVLVGHNLAFDLAFLRPAAAAQGMAFDNPVLDTASLVTLLHPDYPEHSLETLAARCGVTIQGRHTAWGDTVATAEIFLKLLPLLEAKGIHTLGQAQLAMQRCLSHALH